MSRKCSHQFVECNSEYPAGRGYYVWCPDCQEVFMAGFTPEGAIQNSFRVFPGLMYVWRGGVKVRREAVIS